MKRITFLLSLSAMALLAMAPPAAAQVDLQLVVQMPLAVVEVEDTGYPRDDLGLLASGLVASELAPAEVIDVLRWAPAIWYLDELADGDLFLAADPVRVEPVRIEAEPRRLRLIEDRDGSWLITTREDLVLLDLADPEIERQWVIDRDAAVRDVEGREVVRRDRERDRRVDDRGMGAYVQWLHEQGLRGRELADAIHAELRRRGVPAGPKDRLDGPPPASRRFVVERLPEVLVVDGRLVELREGDDERRLLPPGQARERLAAAPRFDGARDADGRLARRGGVPGRAGGRDVAERGRGRGVGRDDRGGGPPDHAAANRGGGGAQGRDARAEGRGQGNRGGGQANAGGGGQGQGKGKGKAKAGGGGGGPGKGKANAGGGGGGGQGKGKGRAGGGGGKGKGKGGGG